MQKELQPAYRNPTEYNILGPVKNTGLFVAISLLF